MILVLSACSTETVLELSKKDVQERLERGEIDFILDAEPRRLAELGKIHPAAPFYAGVLVQARGRGGAAHAAHAAALFEAALESKNSLIRQEAIDRLIPLLLESADYHQASRLVSAPQRSEWAGEGSGKTLRNAAAYVLGRHESIPPEAESPWDRAILLLSSAMTGKEAPGHLSFQEFLLDNPLEAAQRWCFNEVEAKSLAVLSPPEGLAVRGRIAVSRAAYGEALDQFKQVLSQDPALFFRYPETLGDLGRAFQYTSSREEGAAQFQAWDSLLAAGSAIGNIFSVDIAALRFRLLFFGGRIRQRQERYGEAAALFRQALPFAPDPLQKDACIWYLLSVTQSSDPGLLPSLLPDLIPQWDDALSFSDILEGLCYYLVSRREWAALETVFESIRDGKDESSIAQYAYILGRAYSEGYLGADIPPAPEAEIQANAGDAQGMPVNTQERAEGYLRIVLEKGRTNLYYRLMASMRLGEQIALPRSGVDTNGGRHREAMEFLLGFFSYGAASHAFSLITAQEASLSINEVRTLAEKLAQFQRYDESIRLISRLSKREGYWMDRQDLELYYPRPFLDLIEDNVRPTALSPAMVFALIRSESAFMPAVVSHAGAVGLTQLMPNTGLEMAARIGRSGGPDYRREGAVNLRDPEANVHIGVYYLNYLFDLMHSPLLGILSYNAGLGRVPRWRTASGDLPEDIFLETVEFRETRDYGKKILASTAMYGYLYYGLSMERILADTLK